jgi:hypothetical protein
MRVKFLLCFLIIFVGKITAQDTLFNKLWNDPAVVKRIGSNIEQYRKGDVVIEIIDRSGKPVAINLSFSYKNFKTN